MKAKLDKTNAMRKLDAMKISYREHTYTDTDAISGVEVAAVLGQEPDKVFKTLVTQGKSKDLLPLTGYVHGGCSPIGMKKFFPTTIHETAPLYDTIFFSGGRIGFQIELPFTDLEKVIRVECADIIKE